VATPKTSIAHPAIAAARDAIFHAPSPQNEVRLGWYTSAEGDLLSTGRAKRNQTYHLNDNRSRLNGTELLSDRFTGPTWCRFLVDIVEASADGVHMQVTTTMRLAYSEAWDKVGLDATGT
jgi:hypothetical protein